MLSLFVANAGLLALALAAEPQTAFECRWADAPLTIDGKADEKAWERAEKIDNFYLPWLKDKERPAASGGEWPHGVGPTSLANDLAVNGLPAMGLAAGQREEDRPTLSASV